MVTQNLNSYTLEKLDGTPITGLFSARWLREFIPKEGTKLVQEQAELTHQTNNHDSQDDGEKERCSRNQTDDKDLGRILGDEDAATEERGHME